MNVERLAQITHHVERNDLLPQSMATELLQHIRELEQHMGKLRHAGGLMANVCANLSQPSVEVSDNLRAGLDGARRDWDRIIAEIRKWEHP